MALIAVISPGGAPGATTTVLALALAWPEQVLVAECDITGGSVLPGLFGGHVGGADRGLLQVAMHVAGHPAEAQRTLRDQTLALDENHERPLLPGPADPFQARAIDPDTWGQIGRLLAGQSCEVLADVGQVLADVSYPLPLLLAADLIVWVMRPTLRQVHAAHPRLEKIRQAVGGTASIALCVIGRGHYTVGEVRHELGPFITAVQVPDDARAAARLSDGEGRRDIRHSDLLVQARTAARTLRDVAATRLVR